MRSDIYTKLLLHCDGADGSQVFIDSATNKSVTVSNQAQVDTAYSKFGGASLLLDGTTDYLTYANNADWDFGTGDFTVDFWVRRNGDISSNAGIITAASGTPLGWQIIFNAAANANKIHFASKASGTWGVDILSNVTIADTTWTHVAVVRYGNTVTMYFAGQSVGTKNVTGYTYNSSANGLSIGRNMTDATTYCLAGWLDEIRVSKGIARWTSNFTPPTSPYDTPSGGILNWWISFSQAWRKHDKLWTPKLKLQEGFSY